MAKKKSSPPRRETAKSIQAFNMFRDMGANRSLDGLLITFNDMSDPPTRNYGTLRNWSSLFNWDARVKQWDDEQVILSQQRAREEEKEAHRKQLQAFRKAGDAAAIASVAAGSSTLNSLQKTLTSMVREMVVPSRPSPKEVLEVITIIEKSQNLVDKAIDQKSKIEGFDRIARYLEAQSK